MGCGSPDASSLLKLARAVPKIALHHKVSGIGRKRLPNDGREALPNVATPDPSEARGCRRKLNLTPASQQRERSQCGARQQQSGRLGSSRLEEPADFAAGDNRAVDVQICLPRSYAGE